MNEAVLDTTGIPAPDIPETAVVRLHGREMEVRLTRRAREAAAALTRPLVVEMELYFSCLVRKRVLIRSLDETGIPREQMARIGENLLLSFRPVVAEQCRIDSLGENEPPLKTMPVKRPEAYIPHWLTLDVRHDQWSGEFGFTS